MNYLDILNFRYACRNFDTTKDIEKSDIDFILEAARLSPSSFGFEQWDFLVVKDKELKDKIKETAFNQTQISDCSHLIIILAKIKDLKSDSDYIKKMLSRKYEDREVDERNRAKKFYTDKIKELTNDDNNLIFNYTHRQCMFPALNIMNAAASIKIDSCPMEGFDRKSLNNLLGINENVSQASIIIALGYRLDKNQPKRYRRDIKDLVRWI